MFGVFVLCVLWSYSSCLLIVSIFLILVANAHSCLLVIWMVDTGRSKKKKANVKEIFATSIATKARTTMEVRLQAVRVAKVVDIICVSYMRDTTLGPSIPMMLSGQGLTPRVTEPLAWLKDFSDRMDGNFPRLGI